ncbi:MAG TPA: hypothetical protein VE619_00465 [Nitrososphaeraceae archaeon]|nr:hypothetical protein [Nitrososphaeraceae archaeon]
MAPHPIEVAKVILAAVTSEDPELVCMVGDDATMIMQAKKEQCLIQSL